MKDQLKMFFKQNVNKNAPLIIKDQNIVDAIKEDKKMDVKSIKYPYKPILLLSIIKYVEDNKIGLFNNKIIINDDIVCNFYNLITNDYFLFLILKTNKSKLLWDVGFTDLVKNSVYQIMKDNPIANLISEYFVFDKKEKSILIKIDLENTTKNIKLFKIHCLESLKNCVPWYDALTLNDIFVFALKDYDDTVVNLIDYSDSSLSVVKTRKWQHLFRKEVLDRDKKCLICCAQNNSVLQACHIKPYNVSNNHEKFDYQNGITLCANHHKLFDDGYFTFDKNWNVIISKTLESFDDDLFFKQYENCYSNSLKRFANMNVYVDFHKNNIFKNI